MSQRVVWGTDNGYNAHLPFNSRDVYPCANYKITKGLTSSPPSLQNCFQRFPNIEKIAKDLGFTGAENYWTGPGTGGYIPPPGITYPVDVYLENPSDECLGVLNSTDLGTDWLGCLWGTPDAPFSCICPEYGPKFEAYLKLRQNIATFWATPKNYPVKRQEFMDEFQYGRKVQISVAGDFNLRPGMIIYLDPTGLTKNPQYSFPSGSIEKGKYWIFSVKHMITNSGTHETGLIVAQMAESSQY
jgi:hypothetical protein